MILKNLAVLFPSEIWTILTKFAKTKIDEKSANYIEENGLYHFTPNEEVAQLIIKSGYIKESNAVLSYGIPASFLFAGKPDIDAFIKNMADSAENNPLLNPEKVYYAIKINPDKRDLSNYKMRIQDNVILHEGKCILEDDKVEIKQLVIDLVKDKDGNEVLGFRERTKEEIERTTTDMKEFNGRMMAIPNARFTKNTPSEECLKVIEDEKKRLGYRFNGNLTNLSHIVQIDNEKSKNATKNIWNSLKNFLIKLRKDRQIQKIDENPNAKISRLISDIEQGRIDTKKPVLDDKYVNTILELNKQGLRQRRTSQVMQELKESSVFQIAKQKEIELGKSEIPESKIHGINHSRRVAILTSAILQGENIIPSSRESDILITASYYHDIGRILDIGPHARNSVKKLGEMSLMHLDGTEYSPEDRKLLYYLVEGHEGKDKDSDKLLSKYKIDDEDKNRYTTYLKVIKDADALDRARTSSKSRMELNPKYLRLNASRQLIDFSFGLEALSRNSKDNSYMFYEQNNDEIVENKPVENEFIQSLQKHRQYDRSEDMMQYNIKTQSELGKNNNNYDDIEY